MLGGIRRICATLVRISPIVVLGPTSRVMGSPPPMAGTTSIRISCFHHQPLSGRN